MTILLKPYMHPLQFSISYKISGLFKCTSSILDPFSIHSKTAVQGFTGSVKERYKQRWSCIILISKKFASFFLPFSFTIVVCLPQGSVLYTTELAECVKHSADTTASMFLKIASVHGRKVDKYFL
jgi:hypothetical protein